MTKDRRTPSISLAMLLLALALPPAVCTAGHFTLAFQRELPAWENSSGEGCLGGRATRVWIWDENGDIMPDIQLKTTWDVLMGVTDIDGRCQIAWNPGVGYDLVCYDGKGSTSDVARMMTATRWPCWEHYSYELGFLYKTDVANPGTFDTDLNCTWAVKDGTSEQAAYTKSLAYNGVDCSNYWSDQSDPGNWQNPPSYFGQTFIATGNRVISARVNGIIGNNDLLSWKLRIVTFPGLQPVGAETEVPVRWPFGWEAFWGVNDCPVVSGRTYMLQVWRDPGGMNIYHVKKNVYPNGQYYEGTTPFPQYDLNGHVCCMTYGDDEPPPTSDILGHWKLDENQGQTAEDSAADNDGALHGNPIWRPAAGKVDGALEFDGDADYVETPFVLNPAQTPFTALAWIKGGAPGQAVLSQTSGTGIGRSWLCADSSGALMTALLFPGRTGYPLMSQFHITDGNWHHIGIVWDGSRRHLYADGADVSTDFMDIPAPEAADGAMYFAAAPALEAHCFWNGLIDDLRIYDRALAPHEIADIVCADRPKSDLNGDCIVDFADFAIFASEWLTSALP
ncbi:MAG: LamG domain-containing protein [Phycisphaerales bacterium]|nr:MAG: LamG domain-containing protein [Phycisphaerales bacterium]